MSYSPYPPRHVRLARHVRFYVWPVVWRLALCVVMLLLVLLFDRVQP